MSAHDSRAAHEPTAMRITEDPSLYGLVVREHGQLVEFVSYRTARERFRLGSGSAIRRRLPV